MRRIVALALAALAGAARAEEFRDDPDAHATYDGMLRALREAKSLVFTSACSWEAEGKEIGRCSPDDRRGPDAVEAALARPAPEPPAAED